MICFVCKCSYNRWALDIRWTGERGYYWKRAGQSDLACNRTIYAFTFHFYFDFSLFITIGGQVWEGGYYWEKAGTSCAWHAGGQYGLGHCGNTWWISKRFPSYCFSFLRLACVQKFNKQDLTNTILVVCFTLVCFTLGNLQMFNVSLQKGKHKKYPFQFNKDLCALTFKTSFNQTFQVFRGS